MLELQNLREQNSRHELTLVPQQADLSTEIIRAATGFVAAYMQERSTRLITARESVLVSHVCDWLMKACPLTKGSPFEVEVLRAAVAYCQASSHGARAQAFDRLGAAVEALE